MTFDELVKSGQAFSFGYRDHGEGWRVNGARRPIGVAEREQSPSRRGEPKARVAKKRPGTARVTVPGPKPSGSLARGSLAQGRAVRDLRGVDQGQNVSPVSARSPRRPYRSMGVWRWILALIGLSPWIYNLVSELLASHR
jgi:hypothetical protein